MLRNVHNGFMTAQTQSNQSLAQLETTLEEYFGKKAPAMPDDIKELIVKFSPWISVIALVMTLPLILGVLGLGTLLMPFSIFGGATFGFKYIVTFALTAVMILLEALAIPGLFKREKQAWRKLYYVSLISLVESILTLNISGLILGGLISFYILFQTKEKFTN